MLRQDSFSITFNLPPEIIREYYDGLAKVEVAKNSHRSDKSDKSSILNSCKSVLNKFCENSDLSTDTINSNISIGVGINENNILSELSKALDLLKNVKQTATNTDTTQTPSNTETTQTTSNTDNTQTTSNTDNTQTTSNVETTQKTSNTETTQTTSTAETTQTKKSKDKKIKKPYYQDGDNVVVDLNSIAGVFGDNANGGNIGDMMKMFAPMMEGLMGNLNQHKQTTDKQTTDKQTTDKQTTDKQTTDKTTSDKTTSDKTTTDKQTTDKTTD